MGESQLQNNGLKETHTQKSKVRKAFWSCHHMPVLHLVTNHIKYRQLHCEKDCLKIFGLFMGLIDIIIKTIWKKKKKRLSEIVCLQREKSTASFSVLTDRALFIDHFLWYYQSQWTKSIHLHTKCSFIYLFNKSVKQWSNLLCNFIATLSINQQFYSKSIAYIYDHYTVKLHPQLQIENDFICWKDAWLNWLLHRQRVFT